MKKFFILSVLALFTSIHVFSQDQFETSTDTKTGDKIMKGIISRSVLEKEPSFTWYADARKIYTPNDMAVAALKKNIDSIQFLVFMGTWCEDSHFVIPRFFSLVDKSGFPNDHISMIGVDRDKKTLSHLSEALNITNVPTIIVMKNGKEMGRVIEYGPDGLFDKTLGEILSAK